MQVHCDEDVANHIGPESCAGIREDVGEALTGERAGQPLSRERFDRDTDAVPLVEGGDPSSPFADFPATAAKSDFSDPFIIGYGSSPSRCGPPQRASGQAGDLPVPVQRASVHARFYDHAELFKAQ